MTVTWKQGQNSAYEALRTLAAEPGQPMSPSAVSWPPPVAPGSLVGVAALSGAVDQERLDRGLAALEGLGFRTREASNLRSRWQGFAGRDEDRIEGLYELCDDPEIAAIIFARGGHGALRIIDRLDWQRLARHPRAFVGYSDLTPFLLAVIERLGLVAFHGPMVAADLARGLDEREKASFLQCLRGSPSGHYPCSRLHPGDTIEGRLLGGCLSLLVSTLGTEWQPRFDGSELLFLEDTGERRYRVDRMLTQLRLSGVLRRIGGLVLGDLGLAAEGPSDMAEAIATCLGEEPACAVSCQLECGHGSPNLTLPLGARYRLLPGDGGLHLLEGP